MNHQQSKKPITLRTLILVAAVVLLAGGMRAAKAEPDKAAASVWMITTHEVEDYKRWKPVHDRSAAIKRHYGWTRSSVFAVEGDPNHVMVMEQFSSLARARAYAESNDLRDEMAASGVSSEPKIQFVTTLGGEPQP
jgi:hypothetical protein